MDSSNLCSSTRSFTAAELGQDSATVTIGECDDFSPCSVTCGGGVKTCDRTCLDGQWGVHDECPITLRIFTEVCNTKACEGKRSDLKPMFILKRTF